MDFSRLGFKSELSAGLRLARRACAGRGACAAAGFVKSLPVTASGRESLYLPPLAPDSVDLLIEIVLALDCIDRDRYVYSKLYFATQPREDFSETNVVCFEARWVGRAQAVQISLPPHAMNAAVRSGHLRLRLDGLPYSDGRWRLLELRLVSRSADPSLAIEADRRAHRQWVRERVLESEAGQRVVLPHYPESVSLELTPNCNLQCPHCSSHGMPDLHRHHNRRSEMSLVMLERLAAEAFPHASVTSLVGRGEPTRASDRLWECLTALLRRYDLRISCVSNGTRLDGRLDSDLMPWIHEVTFSIDGATATTFETNRRGARFAAVMNNIGRFHEMRSRSGLARRPQLTISWTLKRNNLEELPGFVDLIAPLEPDLLSIRHMVVFQDKEEDQSLLGDRERANHYLRHAYDKLDRLGIRHESPPLMIDPAPVRSAPGDAPFASIPEALCAEREPGCNWMHRTAIIMSDGEVTTCGKHYGARVGFLDERTSLWDIWNGPAMRSLRATFGTADMWQQCRHCWLREIKWHSQRKAKDAACSFDRSEGMDFTQSAWDYRKFSAL